MIPENIIRDYNLSEYATGNWYKGKNVLGIGSFINFYKDYTEKGKIVEVTVKDFEDDKMFDEFIQLVDKNLPIIDFENITKLDVSLGAFDTLVFLPFRYTNIPNSKSDDFDKSLIMVFPAYSFELSGDETTKEMTFMLNYTLRVVDWNRTPSPKVQYKFSNPGQDYGTRGKNLVIDNESNIYLALSNFETSDCNMEIKNYANELIKIEYDASSNLFTLLDNNSKNNNGKAIDLLALTSYIKIFLRGQG